jgi:NADP-dependent 3-hydroxy acid dehydrogenase YdfG
LINNAGNAHGLDPIQNGSLDDWDAMMDINVKGLLYVSNAIIPQMVERNSGHILNIGSTAGKEVYPNGNVYCASKHAVDALNVGMRLDLNKHGIRVGATHTARYCGDCLFIVTRPPHVNIADLIVMCTAQASSTIVKKS